jgi:hypothetical protein
MVNHNNNTMLVDDTAESYDQENERQLLEGVVSAESKTSRPSPPYRSHGARLRPGNDWPNTTIVSVDSKGDQTIIIEGGPFDTNNKIDNNNHHHHQADVFPCVRSPKAAAAAESTFVGGVNSKPRRETVRVLAAKLVRQMQQQQQQKQKLSTDETSSASDTSSASTLGDDEEEEQQQQEGAPPPWTKTKKTFILIGADDDEWDVLVFDSQLNISCN